MSKEGVELESIETLLAVQGDPLTYSHAQWASNSSREVKKGSKENQ